jgi:S-formylglutathione hydrolase
MMNRYQALSWAAGLLVAALLSSCQGGSNVPASQASVPTTTVPAQAVVPATAAPPTPVPATAAPAPTVAPTRAPSRYDTFAIPAPSLRKNLLGESNQREIRVYLPPSYFASNARYPVIYYLPGFEDTSMLGFSLPGDADKLMRSGAIREMIIVVANGANRLGGSFYVNSPVTGGWEDFIVSDVVSYIDSHYRTLPSASARAISGHSMGGFGAVNIAMRHPDVFSVVYSLSPGLFDPNGLAESQLFESEGYVNRFLDYEQRLAALPLADARQEMFRSPDDFTLAYGVAFAPNAEKHPPYLDYPYTQLDGKLVRNQAIWKQWDSGYGGITEKIQQYKANLLRLKGLVIDYGRRDQYAWIPKGSEYFGAQLKAAGIPYEVRSYDGTHDSKLNERIGKYMLPFLSERLEVE